MEKKLAQLLKSRGSLDPAVRGVRVSLRDSYEALLLTSDTSAHVYAAEVEQALWRLHYRGIEEFRTKMRNLSASPNNNRTDRRNLHKDSLSRVVNSFKGFLDEACGYFHGLIVKFRANYGLLPAPSPGEVSRCIKSTDGLSHCAVSCHRLFTYLGDLARYKEFYAVRNPNDRDWTIAANYYKQAAALCPSSGNPHNQLAVLATYTGDALRAIYHYCRSLAVDAPFITARENIILLLEKKRPHVCKVSLLVEGSGQLPFLIAAAEQEHLNYRSSPHLARHKNILQSTSGEESYAMAIKEIWECFQVHFLELLGAVFTKSSLEELEYAVSKSENALQDLFNHHIEELEMTFLPKRLYSVGGSTVRNIPMLEIIVVVIFLIHDSHTQVQNVATTSGTSFATTLLRFCCFVASILVKKAAQSEEKSLNFLLPGVIVFLEWVVSQPSFVKDIKVDLVTAKGLSELKQECTLLRRLFSNRQTCPEKIAPYSVADITSRSTGQTALWEDYELLGFNPLSLAHQDLDFSNLCMIRDSEGSFQVQLQRFMSALNAFKYFIDSEVVYLDSGSRHEEITCNSKGDASCAGHIDNLKETTNLSSSLRDWAQPSNKDLPSGNVPLVSDQERIHDVHENSFTHHLTIEEDYHGSKVDCTVSLKKSVNESAECSKKQSNGAVALEEDFLDAPVHSPQPGGCPGDDGKQSNFPLDLTSDCIFHTRKEPVEKAEGAYFSNCSAEDSDTVCHGDQICDHEGTAVPDDSFFSSPDHPTSPVQYPNDAKRLKVSDIANETLQTGQERFKKGLGVSFPNNYLKQTVSSGPEINIFQNDGKIPNKADATFTSANSSVGLRSSYFTRHSSCNIHFKAKRQPADDLQWLDDYTHIIPAGLKGTSRWLYHNFPIFSSGKKRMREDISSYEMVSNSAEMTHYNSKNPFVRTIDDKFHQCTHK